MVRFSNRNTIHNILKADCQLFFLTQFVRLYFVLPCTLSLTVFVQLYFVLRPHILGSVLLKLCGCFSPYNIQSYSRCFIHGCSHPRVEFFDLASHSFQFGFACAAFPFYFSSSLELFSLFFIHNNTVKSCFQGYVLSSPKINFGKKSCK